MESTTRHCEWGVCEADATTTVNYPAIVPGTAGTERAWGRGVEPLHVCDDCARVARAEVADTWPRYVLRGEGGDTVIDAADDDDAMGQARDSAESGDYGDDHGTVYVDVRVYRADADGVLQHVDTASVVIPPDEPDCLDDKGHDWQSPYNLVGGLEENPGVWGHGGGVIIDAACLRCGCGRKTDTWAQRMDTGEQGLTEVSYEPGRYVLLASIQTGAQTAVLLSGRWELTTDHAASSYGIPVLVDRTSGDAFGPADIIDAYPSWGLMPAVAAVQRLMKLATLTAADLAVVERFEAIDLARDETDRLGVPLKDLKVVLCAICGETIDAFDFAWMVTPKVWRAAGLAAPDCSHLECLSARLGRALTIKDFPAVPFNNILRFGYQMGRRARS